ARLSFYDMQLIPVPLGGGRLLLVLTVGLLLHAFFFVPGRMGAGLPLLGFFVFVFSEHVLICRGVEPHFGLGFFVSL
ncbi:hypothetical protein PUR59_00365, partial [Streptomyces sp. SP18ES09]|uniref:hypothetical protein n=1 Tax=Streptomyces sp. SP18ES09 TaxID=3002532 RepID=UPI002E75D21F